MKYKLFIFQLAFAFISLNYSCSETDKRTTSNLNYSLDSSTHISQYDQNETNVKPEVDFDIEKFVKLTDSLLTTLKGQKINFRLLSDTVKESKLTRADYYLVPESGNKIWQFRFSIYTFSDTIKLNDTFEKIRLEATDIETGDETPALSYTNDNVYKTINQIIWLNTGCHYSFRNHLKLKTFLLRTIQLSTITDSIICECGQSGFGRYGSPIVSEVE